MVNLYDTAKNLVNQRYCMGLLKIGFVFFFNVSILTDKAIAQKNDSITIANRNLNVKNLKGRMGPSVLLTAKTEFVLVVNGFLIADSSDIKRFVENVGDEIKKTKYYSSKKANKKWGVSPHVPIILCRVKRGILIDYKKFLIISSLQPGASMQH